MFKPYLHKPMEQINRWKMVGHVTSSYYSACIGYSFALAVIKGGITVEAEICSPVFYDPKGDRQNV